MKFSYRKKRATPHIINHVHEKVEENLSPYSHSQHLQGSADVHCQGMRQQSDEAKNKAPQDLAIAFLTAEHRCLWVAPN